MGVSDLIANILIMLGGLAIFMYGLNAMSGHLEKQTGRRLRKVFSKSADNRILGVGIGAGVTAVIQSSSATTVMVIGLVNANNEFASSYRHYYGSQHRHNDNGGYYLPSHNGICGGLRPYRHYLNVFQKTQSARHGENNNLFIHDFYRSFGNERGYGEVCPNAKRSSFLSAYRQPVFAGIDRIDCYRDCAKLIGYHGYIDSFVFFGTD